MFAQAYEFREAIATTGARNRGYLRLDPILSASAGHPIFIRFRASPFPRHVHRSNKRRINTIINKRKYPRGGCTIRFHHGRWSRLRVRIQSGCLCAVSGEMASKREAGGLWAIINRWTGTGQGLGEWCACMRLQRREVVAGTTPRWTSGPRAIQDARERRPGH